MPYSKQDIAILFFYYLRYSVIRNYFYFKRHKKTVTRFLAFHDVLPEARNNLENNLRYLKKHTNVISIDDFYSGQLATNKINTVITFDDGYKGWVTNALPVLKKLNLPATFFISSGFVGLTRQAEQDFAKTNLFVKLPPRKITGGLASADVRTLADEGFTIGGHTLNHCSLDIINDISQIRHEITEDKKRLENIVCKTIKYFSYPTGSHNNQQINVIDELIAAGYKGAVTVAPGFNLMTTNRYLLNRDIVNPGMPLSIFKARVLGNIDAVLLLKRGCRLFM